MRHGVGYDRRGVRQREVSISVVTISRLCGGDAVEVEEP
jgi:hypothetical protein